MNIETLLVSSLIIIAVLPAVIVFTYIILILIKELLG